MSGQASNKCLGSILRCDRSTCTLPALSAGEKRGPRFCDRLCSECLEKEWRLPLDRLQLVPRSAASVGHGRGAWWGESGSEYREFNHPSNCTGPRIGLFENSDDLLRKAQTIFGDGCIDPADRSVEVVGGHSYLSVPDPDRTDLKWRIHVDEHNVRFLLLTVSTGHQTLLPIVVRAAVSLPPYSPVSDATCVRACRRVASRSRRRRRMKICYARLRTSCVRCMLC